jgi:hypothetical protein
MQFNLNYINFQQNFQKKKTRFKIPNENFFLIHNAFKNENLSEKKGHDLSQYLKFLPKSFITDRSSPFFGSNLWLNRQGRIDLLSDSFGANENFKKLNNFDFIFKFDPTFKISKNKQKKKSSNYNRIISIGQSQEEKIIRYVFEKNEKNNYLHENLKKIKILNRKNVKNQFISIFFLFIVEYKFSQHIKIYEFMFSSCFFFFTLILKYIIFLN